MNQTSSPDRPRACPAAGPGTDRCTSVLRWFGPLPEPTLRIPGHDSDHHELVLGEPRPCRFCELRTPHSPVHGRAWTIEQSQGSRDRTFERPLGIVLPLFQTHSHDCGPRDESGLVILLDVQPVLLYRQPTGPQDDGALCALNADLHILILCRLARLGTDADCHWIDLLLRCELSAGRVPRGRYARSDKIGRTMILRSGGTHGRSRSLGANFTARLVEWTRRSPRSLRSLGTNLTARPSARAVKFGWGRMPS